nr:MAG TPA: hypothetical protein [Caudoviricetes sp.]
MKLLYYKHILKNRSVTICYLSVTIAITVFEVKGNRCIKKILKH